MYDLSDVEILHSNANKRRIFLAPGARQRATRYLA
jgi:hypothetical protein